MINKKIYFDQVRASLFSGSMAKGQVDGQTAIIGTWEKHHKSGGLRWLAYALATSFHETAFTMQPIHEKGGSDYFFKSYDPFGDKPAVAAQLGNTKQGDGMLFHGRGFVQLTGRRNYTLLGKRFGVDLTSSAAAADRALEPSLAARILFVGMIEGLFTSRRLDQYFNKDMTDWVNARKIINGLDKAAVIAGYGQLFHKALQKAM